jgi:hypothetical protein
MKVYKYTNTVENLKKIGFKFQKLFAKNYHTYTKNDIIMYKVSDMEIEIDNIYRNVQSKIIDFILENKNNLTIFIRISDLDELGETKMPNYYFNKVTGKIIDNNKRIKIINKISFLSNNTNELRHKIRTEELTEKEKKILEENFILAQENLKKYYDFESKFKPISINIINDILELEKLGIEKIDVKIKKEYEENIKIENQENEIYENEFGF